MNTITVRSYALNTDGDRLELKKFNGKGDGDQVYFVNLMAAVMGPAQRLIEQEPFSCIEEAIGYFGTRFKQLT